MAQNSKLKDATKNIASFASKLAQETQTEFNKLHAILEQTNDVVAAIVRVVGVEAVENALQELREERRAALLNQQKAGVKHLVDKGILKPTETITAPDGFVVGTDTVLKDGSERRVQFEMSGIQPEFLPLYVGKKAGDIIEGNGAKLTILEVYIIDHDAFQKSVVEEATLKAQQGTKVDADTATATVEDLPTISAEEAAALPQGPV